jgi:hypothetical protein
MHLPISVHTIDVTCWCYQAAASQRDALVKHKINRAFNGGPRSAAGPTIYCYVMTLHAVAGEALTATKSMPPHYTRIRLIMMCGSVSDCRMHRPQRTTAQGPLASLAASSGPQRSKFNDWFRALACRTYPIPVSRCIEMLPDTAAC